MPLHRATDGALFRQGLRPLRDRLDLTVEVPALAPEALWAVASGESSATVRARVVAARQRQHERYAREGLRMNAELTPGLMAAHCALDSAAGRLLAAAARRMVLSARAYDRLRKVARTIADLAEDAAIRAEHVAEALQFRMMT